MRRSSSHACSDGSPWNDELTDFVTSRSGSPATMSLNAFPGADGASVEPGSSESWRTNTTGRPRARQGSISAPMLRSHSGLSRRPQLGSSNACWKSTTRRAGPLPSVMHGSVAEAVFGGDGVGVLAGVAGVGLEPVAGFVVGGLDGELEKEQFGR